MAVLLRSSAICTATANPRLRSSRPPRHAGPRLGGEHVTDVLRADTEDALAAARHKQAGCQRPAGRGARRGPVADLGRHQPGHAGRRRPPNRPPSSCWPTPGTRRRSWWPRHRPPRRRSGARPRSWCRPPSGRPPAGWPSRPTSLPPSAPSTTGSWPPNRTAPTARGRADPAPTPTGWPPGGWPRPAPRPTRRCGPPASTPSRSRPRVEADRLAAAEQARAVIQQARDEAAAELAGAAEQISWTQQTVAGLLEAAELEARRITSEAHGEASAAVHQVRLRLRTRAGHRRCQPAATPGRAGGRAAQATQRQIERRAGRGSGQRRPAPSAGLGAEAEQLLAEARRPPTSSTSGPAPAGRGGGRRPGGAGAGGRAGRHVPAGAAPAAPRHPRRGDRADGQRPRRGRRAARRRPPGAGRRPVRSGRADPAAGRDRRRAGAAVRRDRGARGGRGPAGRRAGSTRRA